jgi:uncharacterized protein
VIGHRLPVPVFLDLAAGGGGAKAAGLLGDGQRSKTRLLLRELIDRTAVVGHSERLAVQCAAGLLVRLEREHPASVDAVLDHPLVRAWTIEALLAGQARPHRAQPGQLAAVAAAAAVRARVRHTMTLPGIPSADGTVQAVLPTLGSAVFAADPATVTVELRCGPGGAQLTHGERVVRVPGDPDQPGWSPAEPISVETERVRLDLLLDNTSDVLVPELTAAGRYQVAAGRPPSARWRALLADGWSILVSRHRSLAEDVRHTVSMVLPLARPASGLHSVTFHDAYGCVAMSLPPDGLTTAVTLAHEVQHAKLSALMDLFPLVDRDDRTFYAPWRPDPRPAQGLLQGAYAHLGLTAFWAAEASRSTADRPAAAVHAEEELARWRAAAHEVTHILLDQARLTSLGRRFVAGMLEQLHTWLRRPVSRRAMAGARRSAQEHRRRWEWANGCVPPVVQCPVASR